MKGSKHLSASDVGSPDGDAHDKGGRGNRMTKSFSAMIAVGMVMLATGPALASTTYYTTEKTIASDTPANLETMYRAIIDKDWEAVRELESEGVAHIVKGGLRVFIVARSEAGMFSLRSGYVKVKLKGSNSTFWTDRSTLKVVETP